MSKFKTKVTMVTKAIHNEPKEVNDEKVKPKQDK